MGCLSQLSASAKCGLRKYFFLQFFLIFSESAQGEMRPLPVPFTSGKLCNIVFCFYLVDARVVR